MNVTVFGLWHLGCVTAGCTAAAGNRVVGLDFDRRVVEALGRGTPPLSEPGLAELISQELEQGRLSFTTKPRDALAGAEVVWVAFDTPVNEQDEADLDFLRRQLDKIGPFIPAQAIVLISSQVPAGFTRQFQLSQWGRVLAFAYSPENLRLGKAIEVFRRPERIVLGISDDSSRSKLAELFAPFSNRIEWMSIESAEMTKHAINAFLATSVTFANELARLCEMVGADAKEVERGLKSEGRIGPKAYLAPGVAFSGGTLARDLRFLIEFGQAYEVETPLFDGVLASNEYHKNWIYHKVSELLHDEAKPVVAVLGLTYKPGTDTLRRSASIELCRWMHKQDYRIQAFDPAVHELPAELHPMVHLTSSVTNALRGAHLAVIATEWPEFKSLKAGDFVREMSRAAVIDPNWFLSDALSGHVEIRYITTGRDSAAVKAHE